MEINLDPEIRTQLRDIAASAMSNNVPDIEKAIKAAYLEIMKLPNIAAIKEHLVFCAVKTLIYTARHETNRASRRSNKTSSYFAPQKVKVAESKSLAQAYGRMYKYHLAGMVVAEMTGLDLDFAAKTESAAAKGHLFNVALCEKLRQFVPDDRKVKDVIKPRQFEALFYSLSEAVVRG